MKRIVSLLAAGLLSACVAPAPELGERQPDIMASGAVCRIGPEGGPIIADRGIGGTGAPQLVQTATQIVERGIGGIGIVGVITGFASVCVDGLEVSYDGTASVDIDGTAASVAALRAGQVVVITAEGSARAPQARTISVRSEVAGRIDAVEHGSGSLMIAGQPVSVPAGTWGADRFGLGDWVMVSGPRREDGIVVASRMDAAPVDMFAVRGQVVREGEVTRVGRMVLPGAIAKTVKPGQFVTVSGQYVAGQGQVDAIVPDTLFANPAEYFGRSVDRIVVQGFARVANGEVSLNGVHVKAAPGVSRQAGAGGTSIVSLERRPDGSFTAVGVRAADLGGKGSGAEAVKRPVAGAAATKQTVSVLFLTSISPVTSNGNASGMKPPASEKGETAAVVEHVVKVTGSVNGVTGAVKPVMAKAGDASPDDATHTRLAASHARKVTTIGTSSDKSSPSPAGRHSGH